MCADRIHLLHTDHMKGQTQGREKNTSLLQNACLGPEKVFKRAGATYFVVEGKVIKYGLVFLF